MSKDPASVTNDLYKISDQIAAAAKRMKETGSAFAPSASENPPQDDKLQNASARNARILDAALLRRYEDFLKSRRDLVTRLNQTLIQMQTEYELISARADVINNAFQDLQNRLDQLEKALPADAPLPEKQSELAAKCNQLEVIRLESIRSITKYQTSPWSLTAAPQNVPNTQHGIDFASFSFWFLFKKGLALFLPVILAIIAAGLLVALAYIGAFTGVFV